MIDVPPDAGLVVVETTQRLFPFFDWSATALWAVSGAMLGARRGFDPLGVFIVAMASATGGGLLRDGIFLQDGPPGLLRTPIYLGLVAIATLTVILFGRQLRTFRWFEYLVAWVDALGLGAYAVVGMNMALEAHLPMMGAITVGMVNALGGSVLRDLMIGRPPHLPRPGVWLGMVALVGCVLFGAMVLLGVDRGLAGAVTVPVVFLIRAAAVRYDLRSRPLSAFEEDWRDKLGGGRPS
jgi:uncharacterized membrane protein YeiH